MTKKMVIISFGRILLIIIGALITAYGLESILIPNNVSDGGVTGISIVGSTLFGLPLGILIGIINLPFIWLGYKQIGRKFAIFSIMVSYHYLYSLRLCIMYQQLLKVIHYLLL